MISIIIQTITYIAVRRQPWYVLFVPRFANHGSSDLRNNRYIAPKVGHMRSNITNSENTTLFLVSCFHYIFSGLVLNAGQPFRQPIKQNCKTQISHPPKQGQWPD